MSFGASGCKNRACSEFDSDVTRLCKSCKSLSGGNTTGQGAAGRIRRLSEDDKAEIRRRMTRFERPIDIARDFGITVQTVKHAMRRPS